jgi:alanine racemase
MMDINQVRPTRAIVNLDYLSHNFREIRKDIPKETRICGVIKANGYGHGAVKVAETLIDEGIDYLGVATLSEALEIRRKFNEVPILVMGYIPNEQLKSAVEEHITTTIFSLEQGKILSEEGLKLSKIPKLHIKIDTGFHRLGMRPNQESIEAIKNINELEHIEIEGIFSHLALKDEKEDYKQFNLFKKFIEELEKENIHIPIKHICDSIAAAVYKEFCMDMIRPGASLYGYISRNTPMELKPVMTLETKISSLIDINEGEGVSYDYTFVAERKTLVATLPMGYSDGIPRSLSNNGYLYIKGQRSKIIGKICMDQCMVDVTDIDNVEVGGVATLYGYQGNDNISLTDVANLADTNRNEILSLVSRRVPRIYIKDGIIDDILDYLLE